MIKPRPTVRKTAIDPWKCDGCGWLCGCFLSGARPLLFETMVFGGPLDGEQTRYSTWDEAKSGHDAMVTRLESKEPRPRP
jgi:hypothetical protein